MEVVSTEYVKEALDDDSAGVVMVYSPMKYEREHIPGSINIPQNAVDEQFPETFDEDDEIIVYCGRDTCIASERVATRLDAMGYEDVKDYQGGLAAWRDAGLPTEGTLVEDGEIEA